MFDPNVVATILAVAGVGVVGITEMIKRFLHADGFVAYLISLIVSAGATAFTLVTAGTFNWISFAIYTALVFLEANGLYKVVKK